MDNVIEFHPQHRFCFPYHGDLPKGQLHRGNKLRQHPHSITHNDEPTSKNDQVSCKYHFCILGTSVRYAH